MICRNLCNLIRSIEIKNAINIYKK